jgi:hypothetical protein
MLEPGIPVMEVVSDQSFGETDDSRLPFTKTSTASADDPLINANTMTPAAAIDILALLIAVSLRVNAFAVNQPSRRQSRER